MLTQWQFRVLIALAAVSLVLVCVNIVLVTGNREAQNEVSQRAQYIQQTQQIEPLYQGIVRNLAELAAKTNDPQIGQLLASQGITFSVNQPSGQDAAKSSAGGRNK